MAEPVEADGHDPGEPGRAGSKRRTLTIVAAAVAAAALIAAAILVVQHLKAPPGAAADPATAAEHWLHDLGNRDVDAACTMTWGFGADRPPLEKDQRAYGRCATRLNRYVRKAPLPTLRKLQRMKVRHPDVRGDFAVIRYWDISPTLAPDEGPGTKVVAIVVKYRGLWYASALGL